MNKHTLKIAFDSKDSNFDPKDNQSVAVEKTIDSYIVITLKITTTFTSFYVDANFFSTGTLRFTFG